MIKLYHGTSEHFEKLECEDLVDGVDGMMHFHPDYDSVIDQYPEVVECDADIDIRKLPELPDLIHWNPFSMAEEFMGMKILSKEDTKYIEGNTPIDDARQLDTEHLRRKAEIDIAIDIEGDESHVADLRRLLNDVAEFYAEEDNNDSVVEEYESYLKSLDIVEGARERLFEVLDKKGIHAFKYRNQYEIGLKEGYSVAVINPKVLTSPALVKYPPHAPETDEHGKIKPRAQTEGLDVISPLPFTSNLNPEGKPKKPSLPMPAPPKRGIRRK